MAYPKFFLLQYSYVSPESLRVLPDGKSPRWSAIWVQNNLVDYLPFGHVLAVRDDVMARSRREPPDLVSLNTP